MLEAILGLLGVILGFNVWLSYKVGTLNGIIHSIQKDVEELKQRAGEL